MRTSVHTCECEAPHSVNGAGGKKNEWAVRRWFPHTSTEIQGYKIDHDLLGYYESLSR